MSDARSKIVASVTGADDGSSVSVTVGERPAGRARAADFSDDGRERASIAGGSQHLRGSRSADHAGTSRSLALANRENSQATTHVVIAPMNTYHVNATLVQPQTAVIVARPGDHPDHDLTLADARHQRAEQEGPEDGARGEGQHRQTSVQHRPIHPLGAEGNEQAERGPSQRLPDETPASAWPDPPPD